MVTLEPWNSSFSRRSKQGRSGLRSASPSGFHIRAASTSSNPMTPNIESAFRRSNAEVHLGNSGLLTSGGVFMGQMGFLIFRTGMRGLAPGTSHWRKSTGWFRGKTSVGAWKQCGGVRDRARESQAGRKPWDAVMMFKTIILRAPCPNAQTTSATLNTLPNRVIKRRATCQH